MRATELVRSLPPRYDRIQHVGAYHAVYHLTGKMPKAISLFAGAGGCSLGFKQAGFDIVFATDFDKSAMRTCALNFAAANIACKEINELDFDQLLSSLKLRRRRMCTYDDGYLMSCYRGQSTQGVARSLLT